MDTSVSELRGYMMQFAFDVGNAGLQQAVRYARNLDDLRACVKQAHGVGSERFQEAFKHILEEESNDCY